jgi:hypothetical protein
VRSAGQLDLLVTTPAWLAGTQGPLEATAGRPPPAHQPAQAYFLTGRGLHAG